MCSKRSAPLEEKLDAFRKEKECVFVRRGVRREGRRAEKRGVRSRVDVPQDQKAIIHHR